MTDFKYQLKSFLSLSFGLLLTFISTPSYAMEASEEFEIQYSPPFLSDGMPISLKGKWKVWTLVGEPAKELHVVWKNNDFVTMGNEYYGPRQNECYSVPQSVLNEVSLINLKLKAKVAGGYQLQSPGYYIIFDAGSMKKAANPDTYSEQNFTVSAIKNWDELFIVDDLSKRFASEYTAKRIIKAGLRLGTPEVYSVGFNLGPVRDWIRSCKRKKGNTQKKLEKKLAEQAKTDQHNDFDQKLRQLAEEENQSSDVSASSKNQEELSFEARLAALPAQWAEQEKIEKEILAREAAEKKKHRQKTEEKRQQLYNCNDDEGQIGDTYLSKVHVIDLGPRLKDLNRSGLISGEIQYGFLNTYENIAEDFELNDSYTIYVNSKKITRKIQHKKHTERGWAGLLTSFDSFMTFSTDYLDKDESCFIFESKGNFIFRDISFPTEGWKIPVRLVFHDYFDDINTFNNTTKKNLNFLYRTIIKNYNLNK